MKDNCENLPWFEDTDAEVAREMREKMKEKEEKGLGGLSEKEKVYLAFLELRHYIETHFPGEETMTRSRAFREKRGDCVKRQQLGLAPKKKRGRQNGH